jgi:hypothetical protein
MIKQIATWSLCIFFSIQFCSAFTSKSQRQGDRQIIAGWKNRPVSFQHAQNGEQSSYDFDSDSDVEQYMGEHDIAPSDEYPVTTNGANKGRYSDLIASVGLEGKLKQVADMPDERAVSNLEVFCNRDLKVDKLAAIGFDMDYTLAQYKQPAFDQLAFDGAKEKLVKKLGYPEEVLDFEYDHKVRLFLFTEIHLSHRFSFLMLQLT